MKGNRLYERGIGWVQYKEELYIEIRRERARICARMRRQKRCTCPKDKQWRCHGVCEGCCFAKTPDVSLNVMLGESEELTLNNALISKEDQENISISRIYAEEKLKRLDEIMPKAREIGVLRMEGKSDREIAKILGIPRTSMYRMLDKAKSILSVEFEEI